MFAFLRVRAEQEREEERRGKGQERLVFYNLISEVTSHPFCCILFVRLKSLDPALTQSGEESQGMNTRNQGSLGAILEAAHLTHSVRFSSHLSCC